MNIVELFKKHKANKFANSTELVYKEILPDSIDDLLEIGVCGGGSLNAWCEFYPDANIFGIDIDRSSVDAYKGRAVVYLGNVSDVDFMNRVVSSLPSLDVIIDDGSHNAKNQQDAFHALFPALKSDGIYVIEDLHVATDVHRLDNGYPGTLLFLRNLPHEVKFYFEHTAVIRRRT